MKNKAIFFTLHIDVGTNDLWRQVQLYHALSTLYETNPNPNFDVLVFVSGESYIGEQVKQLFPLTKVIQYEHNVNDYAGSLTCVKWECFSKCYDMGYGSALSLDGDVIFRDNVDFIFDKYHDYDYYGILDKMFDHNDEREPFFTLEGKVINLIRLNGFRAMNGGQILLNIRALEIMKKNLHTLKNEINHFQSLFSDYIKDKDMSTWKNTFPIMNVALWVNEQWAGHNILRKQKLTFNEFDYDDIYQTSNKSDLYRGKILHYTASANMNEIVPESAWEVFRNGLKYNDS